MLLNKLNPNAHLRSISEMELGEEKKEPNKTGIKIKRKVTAMNKRKFFY
jgi:hypothetical protein